MYANKIYGEKYTDKDLKRIFIVMQEKGEDVTVAEMETAVKKLKK